MIYVCFKDKNVDLRNGLFVFYIKNISFCVYFLVFNFLYVVDLQIDLLEFINYIQLVFNPHSTSTITCLILALVILTTLSSVL